MQTGSPGTLIGWKSGQTTYVPLWDRMEGAELEGSGRMQSEQVGSSRTGQRIDVGRKRAGKAGQRTRKAGQWQRLYSVLYIQYIVSWDVRAGTNMW
jgi:hypothetical protein